MAVCHPQFDFYDLCTSNSLLTILQFPCIPQASRNITDSLIGIEQKNSTPRMPHHTTPQKNKAKAKKDSRGYSE